MVCTVAVSLQLLSASVHATSFASTAQSCSPAKLPRLQATWNPLVNMACTVAAWAGSSAGGSALCHSTPCTGSDPGR
jgi:hypothetical protein